MGYRQSARDIVASKEDAFKKLNAGFNQVHSSDPFIFEADDGTRFPNAALRAQHNLAIRAKDQGNQTYDLEQKRLYRRA